MYFCFQYCILQYQSSTLHHNLGIILNRRSNKETVRTALVDDPEKACQEGFSVHAECAWLQLLRDFNRELPDPLLRESSTLSS